VFSREMLAGVARVRTARRKSRARPNTVYLRGHDWAAVQRWGVAVVGVFELVVRHFAFDDSRERRAGSSSWRISAVTQISASPITSGGKTGVGCSGSAGCPK